MGVAIAPTVHCLAALSWQQTLQSRQLREQNKALKARVTHNPQSWERSVANAGGASL